ncbi:hypothetical protein CORC01_12001 [Colletotrichum orchidophilum]|uniref:DUF7492 domain-containing protein n=1 Tax=Colletotrichum orchidophilum TaxID=1209926 RepID=A0A1G4AU75_9PEZI|nr:uncharacterized protein CORC01_12001 [Colletotrichum orchidophilum]OHE92720.1 hypothetical protein CORC01_12001 [Colletotrichum orchidophilum]
MVRPNSFAMVVAAIIGVPLVESHTWVEQLNRVAANGTLVGPDGFSSGWAGREGNFNDNAYTMRMPDMGFNLCEKQTLGTQAKGFPALTAAPGDFVSLRYQENGHVTIPSAPGDKPLNRGTVFVYGTTQPKVDASLFDVHRQWTADGKGGDGTGRLLATRNFDDGQCHQANDHPISKERQAKFPHEAIQPMGVNIWCQTAIQLPEDLAQNSDYSIYWVWSWPTLKPDAIAKSSDGQFADFPAGFTEDKRAVTSEDVVHAEVYSSCSSIKIQGEKLVAGAKASSSSSKSTNDLSTFTFPEKQDFNYNAIKDQLANAFQVSVNGQAAPNNSAPNNGTQSSAPVATHTPTPTAPAGAASDTNNAHVLVVTAPAMTLYSILTVTVPAQLPPTPTPTGGQQAAEASVTPFLQGRHIRGRDSWNFGQRN